MIALVADTTEETIGGTFQQRRWLRL